MDMTESIAPRSDQINAENFLSGPRTVTIVEVRKGASAEQPVEIVLAEFGPGQPFKPSKTVRRILVAGWGPDAATYAGKRMTLYRDPAVRFGGQDVGGIRVSHMSGIDKRMTLALTVTRGKRAPYVVEPLPDAPTPPADGITPEQSTALFAALKDNNLSDREAIRAYISDVIGREIASSKELTQAEAQQVIESLAPEPTTDQPDGADTLPGTDQ